jgi:hypothetical protein
VIVGSANPSGQANSGQAAPAAGGFDAAVEAFLKIAKQPPEERIREAILKRHGLTEAGYNALPRHAREAIEREIVEEIKRSLKIEGAANASRDRPAPPLEALLG